MPRITWRVTCVRACVDWMHLASTGCWFTAPRISWVRVAANMSLGAYEVYEASGSIPDPEWPDVTFRVLLEIAFKGRFIQSLDHPVIHRLQGET